MMSNLAAAMNRATTATRASDLAEATRIIQAALTGRLEGLPEDGGGSNSLPEVSTPLRSASSERQRSAKPRLDPQAEIIEPEPQGSDAPSGARGAELRQGGFRLRRPLGEVIRTLREGRLTGGLPSQGGLATRSGPSVAPPPVPDGASFTTRSFTCAAGVRSYKLYVPAPSARPIRGLVVMLHGCKQNPDDFATGTNMNALAEIEGLLVVYPQQASTDNLSSCWNWFEPKDQRRDAGEPAIIAGITQAVRTEFGAEEIPVLVAGLSAGGAMAAVMAATYPEIYTAVGIHSGLPYGSANDVLSAFGAMRGNQGLGTSAPGTSQSRTIVFQGSADRVVHPVNAERIMAAAGTDAMRSAREDRGRSQGGRDYVRTIVEGPDGTPRAECWLIANAGHAWSGGQPRGSYTDPDGPDASAEMLRFFLAAD